MANRIGGILAAATAVLLAAGAARAADREVTIGFQTTIDPAKVAQADGTYEKAIGWKINWRRFDSGADVITAIAAGDVQIGYVGSSPLAAAASRELPIQTIHVATLIGEAEALVVRHGAGIKAPGDLVGRKVAVPFVSTTHYSLLAALKHWGIDPKQVRIVNLRPPEIGAAWQRGDIDAAYVWDPALGKIKESGDVLVTSKEVASWGAPTFDAWIARKDFASANPDVVRTFVRVTDDAYAAYHRDPSAWTVSSPQAAKIAKLTGAKAEDVPAVLAGNAFPTAAEQASPSLLGGGTVAAIQRTSAFLKEQGRIDRLLPDYGAFVEPRFVQDAIAAR
ncbi:taurine ABC transporter substrate-binding protein [Arenibaculum pallidiluteum]|uniref:taurine ABC transporter substrate-binding protein n=1 Tax=Arenibaculum pallidiluteum TaxID=2812559 RepID=UPI001A9572FE|nr:taurine ABC transporter substrate-binding protein [Arenibaculum pallidiluteum]